MARFRRSEPELATQLGWDSNRINCLQCSGFEKGFLRDAAVLAYHLYGPGRGIAAISLPGLQRFVVATIGLDPVSEVSLGLDAWDGDWYASAFDADVTTIDEDAGDVVPYGVVFELVIDALKVDSGSPHELINILMGAEPVYYNDSTAVHETPIVEVLPLFPNVIVYGHADFEIMMDDRVDVATVQRGMAQIALIAAASSESISDPTRAALSSTLSQVGKLVPFTGFTRAAYDIDPRSIFMALYRSLENLYAYSEVSLLIQSLSLKISWVEAAEVLADQLKWRPREEEALRKVFTLAAPDAPLEDLINSLPGEGSVDETTNLPKMAAARLYSVRNSVVHVRPGLRGIDADVLDWDALSVKLAACVLAADIAVESGKTLDP